MALITLLNSYVINDISSIIYDYYYDLHKIKELKKELLIEYHKKIYNIDNSICYYQGYGLYIKINNRFDRSEINNKIYRFNINYDLMYMPIHVAILPKNY